MADEKVLVVDDEVGMLTLLRNYLTSEGHGAGPPCSGGQNGRHGHPRAGA